MKPLLYPYQQRWLADKSRFKIALNARQLGFSFIIALEGLLEAFEKNQTVIFVSTSERQSIGRRIGASKLPSGTPVSYPDYRAPFEND